MSGEKPTCSSEPPADTSSAGSGRQVDPLPVSASQHAWRQALCEELRAAWQTAEEMLEILPTVSRAPFTVEVCAADAGEQLDVLKGIFGRLNEKPPFPRHPSSLFWKLMALSAEPAEGGRDSALHQALHRQLLLISQQWQSASECCIRCGVVDVAELLQAGAADRQAAARRLTCAVRDEEQIAPHPAIGHG